MVKFQKAFLGIASVGVFLALVSAWFRALMLTEFDLEKASFFGILSIFSFISMCIVINILSDKETQW